MNTLIKTTLVITLTVMFFLLIQSVSALTATIGNSKMILYPESDEEITRSILVKNVNDVPVTITFNVDPETTNVVKLEEETFSLLPGEEKKAFFTIRATTPKTESTRIQVQFSSEEDKNTVGLASTVSLNPESNNEDDFAPKPEEKTSFFSNLFNSDEPPVEEEEETPEPDVMTGSAVKTDDTQLIISPILILTLTTIILAVVLAALFVYAKRRP